MKSKSEFEEPNKTDLIEQFVLAYIEGAKKGIYQDAMKEKLMVLQDKVGNMTFE